MYAINYPFDASWAASILALMLSDVKDPNLIFRDKKMKDFKTLHFKLFFFI